MKILDILDLKNIDICFSWINPNKILDLDPRTRNSAIEPLTNSSESTGGAARSGNAPDDVKSQMAEPQTKEESASFGVNPWDTPTDGEDSQESANSDESGSEEKSALDAKFDHAEDVAKVRVQNVASAQNAADNAAFWTGSLSCWGAKGKTT